MQMDATFSIICYAFLSLKHRKQKTGEDEDEDVKWNGSEQRARYVLHLGAINNLG